MKEISGISRSELIEKLAVQLKQFKEISQPEWINFVKSGVHKERPIVKKDFWYIRSASILLKIHRLGPIGVAKLRTLYGGKKRRGHAPAEFRKGSGSIIRHILQQLEKAGLIRQIEKGVRKGKVITDLGNKLISKASKQ